MDFSNEKQQVWSAEEVTSILSELGFVHGRSNRESTSVVLPSYELSVSFQIKANVLWLFGELSLSRSSFPEPILKKKARTAEDLSGKIFVDVESEEDEFIVVFSCPSSLPGAAARDLVAAGLRTIEAAHAYFLNSVGLVRHESLIRPSENIEKPKRMFSERPDLKAGEVYCPSCNYNTVLKRFYNPQRECLECNPSGAGMKVGGAKKSRAAARIERSMPRWR